MEKISNNLNNFENKNNPENINTQRESFYKNIRQSGKELLRKGRKGLVTFAFLASALPAFAKSGGEGDPVSKNNKKQEVVSVQDSAKKGLVFYKGGMDKTPTGKTNAFFNNESNMTESRVYELAKKFNLRTDDNKLFQEDLFNYAKKNNPEILQNIYSTYGNTRANKLEDNILGARVANLLNYLDKITPNKTENIDIPKNVPEVKKTPNLEITKKKVNIDNSYIVNVRGDEKEKAGTFYVLNKETFKKLQNDLLGTYSNVNESGNWGQITVDMNDSVFKSRLSEDQKNMLGNKWNRDTKNPNILIEESGADISNDSLASK